MISWPTSMARHRSAPRPAAARSAAGAVVGLLLLATSGAAEERDQARAKLAEGVRLLEAGKPAAALARFEEAYAIVPSPKIQYNMALAYSRMDRNADAFMAYGRFLREATDGSAEHISHARQELERLSKNVAFVELVCDVPGASVLIDGRRVGLTPLPDRLPVDTGPHEIVVQSAGLEDGSRRFTAVAGESVTLRIDLRRPAANLTLAPRESPAPAAVMVQEKEERAATGQGTSWKKVAGYGLLAAGVAGAIGGGYFVLRQRGDGCGDPLPGFACNTTRPSTAPGWVLLGAGAGLAVGGGILLYAGRDARIAMMMAPGTVFLRGTL